MKQFIIIDMSFNLISHIKPILQFKIGDYLIDDVEVVDNKISKMYVVNDDIIKLNNGEFTITLQNMLSNNMNGFVTKTSWSTLNKFYIIPEYIFNTDLRNHKKFKMLKEKAYTMQKTKRQNSVKNYFHNDNTIHIKRFLKLYTGGYHLLKNQIMFSSFDKNINGTISKDYIKGDLFTATKETTFDEGVFPRHIIKYKPIEITSPGNYHLKCKKKHKIWSGYTDVPNGGYAGVEFGYPDLIFDNKIDPEFNEDFLYNIQTKYTQYENSRDIN